MKWLDFLASWSTTLSYAAESELDMFEFLEIGQYEAKTDTYIVGHDAIQDCAELLRRYNVAHTLYRILLRIASQHRKLGTSLRLRVCDSSRGGSQWRRLCRTLFQQRWVLNWRAVLDCGPAGFGLQYIGLSDTACFAFGDGYIQRARQQIAAQVESHAGCNADHQQPIERLCEQLECAVFQILWTFAVLSRTGLHVAHAQVTDAFAMFDDLLIQCGREEHFDSAVASENAFFLRREQADARIDGVYMVPLSTAFVTFNYEPAETPGFLHRRYFSRGGTATVGDDGTTLKSFFGDPEVECTASLNEVERGTYLCIMAGYLRQYIFADLAHTDNGLIVDDKIFGRLYASLCAIESCQDVAEKENAYEAFFDSDLAQFYWRDLVSEDREHIIDSLQKEGALPVLVFPLPDESSLRQLSIYNEQRCGFANIENNCFLNSVLFALMSSAGEHNTFRKAVQNYNAGADLSEEDFCSVQNIEGYIFDEDERERIRLIIAQLFCTALQTAYDLSECGRCSRLQMQQLDFRIGNYCKNLLPLLDLWSLATRDTYFANEPGEFQDVGECLQLLCELLQFEQCCLSTVAITEEFRDLPYDRVDQDGLLPEHLEEMSMAQQQNPLCLRVRSGFEWPLLRLYIDWTQMMSLSQRIDLQRLCDEAAIETSVVPAPRTQKQKEHEKVTGETSSVSTRFIVKRHVRSDNSHMFIIHIPRQKDLRSLHTNIVDFPADGAMRVNGHQTMSIESLVLWRHNHYTSLVRDSTDGKWYHIDDMSAPGRRFKQYGDVFGEAVARIDNEGFIVTTICCVRSETNNCIRSDRSANSSLQLHNEVQKFALENDMLNDKALVMRKDSQLFQSAGAAANVFGDTLVQLPDRFLFGRDDPTKDFYFQAEWYNLQKPFAMQPTQLALVLAAGAPNGAKVLPISTLFDCNALPTMHLRAERTRGALSRLLDKQALLNDEAINMTLEAMQARHLCLSPRQYVQAGGTVDIRFAWRSERRLSNCDAIEACTWFFNSYFFTLLRRDADRVHNQFKRRADGATFDWTAAENILVPVHEEDRQHWTLLRVQPKLGLILYYDSLASNGSELCRTLADYLAEIGDGQQFECRNVYEQPIQRLFSASDVTSCGVFVLHFCSQIFGGHGDQLRQIKDVSTEEIWAWRKDYAALLSQYGDLNPL